MLIRSEEHTSELQSRQYLVCRLLLEKKNKTKNKTKQKTKQKKKKKTMTQSLEAEKTQLIPNSRESIISTHNKYNETNTNKVDIHD